MSYLILLAVIVGFIAVAFGVVRACERIIDPDATVSRTPVPSRHRDPERTDDPDAVRETDSVAVRFSGPHSEVGSSQQ